MKTEFTKKIITTGILAILLSGCATFKSGDIPNSTIKYIAKERQYFLETGDSKTVHSWNRGSVSGIMYIVNTTKDKNGLYCRKLYEQIVEGLKEAEMYNEWCRTGNKKWDLRVQ